MNFIRHSNQIALYDDNHQLLADITFPDIDSDTINLNHTYVADSLRGQGVAGKLMEEVVQVMTEQNKKAVLTCSYAVKWFKNHPEYDHLIR